MFNLFRFLNKTTDKNDSIDEYESYLLKENTNDKKNVYGFNDKYANQEQKLYNLYGKCDEFNGFIKMIIISDTHYSLKEEKFREFVNNHSEYDVCILLGDHSHQDISTILKYIDNNKLYVLLGNHDQNYINMFRLNNLNGKIVNINGVNILGIEGSFKYKPTNFPSFTQKESIEFLNNKPKVDILFSHDNRFNSDMQYDSAHQGLFGITYYLYKNKVPYHIHGHIHDSYVNDLINGTKEISIYQYEYIELNNNLIKKLKEEEYE